MNLKKRFKIDNRLLLVFVAGVALSACSSCKFLGKKKDSQKNPGAETKQSLIIKDRVFLERTTNLTEVIIRFETTETANCEIQYWLKARGEDVADSDRESARCSQSGETKEFSEVIPSLKPKELYYFEILAWKPDDTSRGNVSRIRIAETELKGDSIAFVARINLPLRSLEVHQTDLPDGKSLDALVSESRIQSGCRPAGEVSPRPWANISSSNIFTALNTRGFITGSTERMKQGNNRFRMYFNSIQAGDSWEWSFKTALGSGQFLAQKAPIIQRATLTGVNKVDMGEPQLTVAEKSVAEFDGETDLRIAVAADANIPAQAIATVQIGFPDQEGSVACFFKAADGSFTIKKDDLGKLPKGKHDLFLQVYTDQVQQDLDKKLPPWLIEAYDWRVARIDVL